jgi:hypothetical protein
MRQWILHWSQVCAHIRSLTQVHPELHIKVLQVLKLQDPQSWHNMNLILTMHQLVSTYGVQHPWCSKLIGVKTSHCGSFHEPSLVTYSRLIHTSNYSRKRPTNQTIITFVDEQDYERPHTNNGILDIKGQHQLNEL